MREEFLPCLDVIGACGRESAGKSCLEAAQLTDETCERSEGMRMVEKVGGSLELTRRGTPKCADGVR